MVDSNGNAAPLIDVRDAKTYEPDVIRRSVVNVPTTESIPPTDQSFVLYVASQADGFIQWGKAPKLRDKQLREFIPTESWFASALSAVCARNAAFSWKLVGPDRLVEATQEMMLNANRGRGWQSFVIETSMDLYTQDNGAFIEIIRAGESEFSTVLNFAHLDAARCYQTGNPEVPVIYQDRYGKLRPLRWYQVVHLPEMPSGIEHQHGGVFYALQYSAATRLLRSAQILRNIAVYKDEKTAGRFMRAVHLLRGVSQQQVQDAMDTASLAADQAGLLRYMSPLMVSSVSPDAEVGHDTIELAALPDGFDEEVTMKWYVAALALAFLVDYQEFAPLPGGGLGTSNQSQVLHAKARGKGPGLFQKLFAHMLNFRGILPRSVSFEWDEQDVDADKMQAALVKERAEASQVRITSGEIDPVTAREIAVANGDLTQEQFDALMQRDTERQQTEAQQAAAQEALRREELAMRFGAQDDTRAGGPVDSGGSDSDVTASDSTRTKAALPAQLEAEAAVEDEVADILSDAWQNVTRRLRRESGGEDRSPVPTAAKGRKRVKTAFQRDNGGRVIGAVQEETWVD